MISWVEGEKRGVSTRFLPLVRNLWPKPSWSMIASRLTRLVAGPVSDDIDDAGVEIAVLAGDAGIDRIGDAMGDAAPVAGRRREREAGHLLLREHVPQPELDPQAAVGLLRDDAR